MTTGDRRRAGPAGWAARLLRVRWVVRAPVWLYRAHLGVLLGPRLLMLEHLGRVSGRRRYVVLEVVDGEPGRRYVVASGFGESSDWFRNLMAHPQARLWCGRRGPLTVDARRLTTGEARATLESYARRHPKAWRKLKPVLEGAIGVPIETDGVALPLVELVTRPGAG